MKAARSQLNSAGLSKRMAEAGNDLHQSAVQFRLIVGDFGDFGDFGVSFASTVAGRYTRRGGPRLSVQGEPLLVPTRETMRVTLVTLVSLS